MRYLAGLVAGKGNLIPRGTLTVSDENALFPMAKLGNGLLSEMFQHGTAGADRLFTVDLNELLNLGGGFEGASIAPWVDASSGGGSAAQDAVTFHSGAKSLKCIGGAAGIGKAYVDLVVRTDEPRVAAPWLFGGGGAIAARYQIQDLGTGKFLQVGGASWGAAADLFTRTVASWGEQGPLEYQVEGWSVRQASLTTLRFICYCNQNGTVYFDDVADWPKWNLLAILGHNHAPVLVPQLRGSTDGFGASDVLKATLTPYFPSYFAYLTSAATERHARLKLVGTNVASPAGTPFAAAGAAPLICEAVLGYAKTSTRGAVGGSEEFELPQSRSDGGEYVYQHTLVDQGSVSMDLRYESDTKFREALEEISRRSGFGADTTLVVPRNDGTRVLLGRIEQRLTADVFLPDGRETTVQLTPLPFPTMVT